MSATIDWQFYPATRPIPQHLREVISLFEAALAAIGSHGAKLSSNEVLRIIGDPLRNLGFLVEAGHSRADRVWVPVLFGRRGKATKSFAVDAYSEANATVVEVEAGRAVANNQFLKDLFEACVMPTVDFCVIAVRSNYRGGNDFESVCSFLDSLFASDRLRLPLKGVLVVGY